jgi:hypothetical protein
MKTHLSVATSAPAWATMPPARGGQTSVRARVHRAQTRPSRWGNRGTDVAYRYQPACDQAL